MVFKAVTHKTKPHSRGKSGSQEKQKKTRRRSPTSTMLILSTYFQLLFTSSVEHSPSLIRLSSVSIVLIILGFSDLILAIVIIEKGVKSYRKEIATNDSYFCMGCSESAMEFISFPCLLWNLSIRPNWYLRINNHKQWVSKSDGSIPKVLRFLYNEPEDYELFIEEAMLHDIITLLCLHERQFFLGIYFGRSLQLPHRYVFLCSEYTSRRGNWIGINHIQR